jgi:hypothetical protein
MSSLPRLALEAQPAAEPVAQCWFVVPACAPRYCAPAFVELNLHPSIVTIPFPYPHHVTLTAYDVPKLPARQSECRLDLRQRHAVIDFCRHLPARIARGGLHQPCPSKRRCEQGDYA